MKPPSVNQAVAPLLAALCRDAEALRLQVQTDERGVTLIDAGIACRGSVAAGLRIAELCLGGLGRVRLRHSDGAWPDWLDVSSSQPVLACLASQYAGWRLAASKEEGGGRRFQALGSGPARALAAKEPLFADLGYRDDANGPTALVLEVDRVPPAVVIDKVLRDCGLAPDRLSLVLTPTTSLAGTTQVVARVLEVALHKAHELKFPLAAVREGSASVPLPPPHADALQAMGRSNDAILYGGRVHLSVDADDDAAADLARRLPSSQSADHGRPFAELFQAAGGDFYRIDPGLFAPAQAWVTSLVSGRTWQAGHSDLGLLLSDWLRPVPRVQQA